MLYTRLVNKEVYPLMSKQFWAVVAVIILIFVGVFALQGNKNNTSSSTSAAKPSEHITGKGSSGVTIVEYGDFQCPYCQQYEPIVSAAVAKFYDQIYFQFRNFPLVNNHPNAFAAARAAEAASKQGKFWEMHNLLYQTSNWQVWTTATDPVPEFNKYAVSLGLDEAQFKKDFASSAVNDTINADMAEGTKLDVQGTPTFFIDGKQVTIKATPADFEKAISDAIAAKKK